jgi:hypothetical protein
MIYKPRMSTTDRAAKVKADTIILLLSNASNRDLDDDKRLKAIKHCAKQLRKKTLDKPLKGALKRIIHDDRTHLIFAAIDKAEAAYFSEYHD